MTSHLEGLQPHLPRHNLASSRHLLVSSLLNPPRVSHQQLPSLILAASLAIVSHLHLVPWASPHRQATRLHSHRLLQPLGSLDLHPPSRLLGADLLRLEVILTTSSRHHQVPRPQRSRHRFHLAFLLCLGLLLQHHSRRRQVVMMWMT